MAIRVDYIAKETGNNLVRNPSLTVASILTVAVSLALFGAALLVERGVQRLDTRFQDGVEFIIWMQPEATQEQKDAVERALESSPGVAQARYVTREETFVEFQEFYRDQPEVLTAVTPDILPTSWRVVPEIADADVVRQLGDEFSTLPGVRHVDYALEQIENLNRLFDTLTRAMLAVAAVSAVAAALLMYNTIRTALFARRREVEVMKLVGATNWFIRIPFMLEGLIQGITGALFSVFAVYGLNRFLRNFFQEGGLELLSSFAIDSGQVGMIAIVLLVLGAVMGAVGSGIAVSRYLDV
jgi:cell division transport system permease protein